MTEPRSDERATDDAPVSPAEADALERRAFVRRMGTDAVRTAGTVFSLSRILTRSAAAAGQTVINELERIQVGDPAAEPAAPVVGAPPDVTLAAVEASMPAIVDPAPPRPPAPVPVLPELRLDGGQRAILEAARTAVVAVNREGHPPQLTMASVLWDGATLRFLTLGWARRTTMLRADPRIGFLVEDPGDGRFVTATGRARIAEGREAREEALPVLLRDADGDAAAADAAWAALVAEDADRAVIVVEPDQVLSGRR